jgi:UDP-N-acetylmuramate dehydrogenase
LNKIYIKGTKIYAESSISLQKLASFCLKNNLYCLDFLYSIPGTLGGAIYMNAGRGEKHNQSISKYIVKVEVFDGNRTFFLKNEDCKFSHRSSIFQKKKYLILSCLLKLPKQDFNDGLNKIRKRIKFVQETQELKFPSAGTVFKNNFSLINKLKGYQIGGANFSEKNPAFIINVDNASFEDVNKLIEYAKDYYQSNNLQAPDTELCIIN